MGISRYSHLVLAALVLGAGCMPVAQYRDSNARVIQVDDEFDDFDDVMEEFEERTERPRKSRRRAVRAHTEPRGGSTPFGIRAGALAFLQAETEEPATGLLIGAFYHMALGNSLILELSTDVAPTQEGMDSIAFFGRTGIMWRVTSSSDLYLIADVGAGHERYFDGTSTVGMADLGVGMPVNLGGRMIDLRGTYGVQFESENVEGIVTITGGYRF